MIKTQTLAGRTADLDALAAKIEIVRKDVTGHLAEHLQWKRTWHAMLATHQRTRAELAARPRVLGLLAEELRLDTDVLFYEIARWMACRPASSQQNSLHSGPDRT